MRKIRREHFCQAETQCFHPGFLTVFLKPDDRSSVFIILTSIVQPGSGGGGVGGNGGTERDGESGRDDAAESRPVSPSEKLYPA